MPGINSRRVFINQNRDRVKNPTEMYAFSALRLARIRNKQRDKHYEVAAAEASSVINARVHTHTRRWAWNTRARKERERERENADPLAFLPRIYEDRQDLPASKKNTPAAEESRLISIRRYFIQPYYCALPFEWKGTWLSSIVYFLPRPRFSLYIYIYSYRCFRRSKRGEACINYFE